MLKYFATQADRPAITDPAEIRRLFKHYRLFSYIGAATQDWVSGLMIESTKQVSVGVASYDFNGVFIFGSALQWRVSC